MKKIVSILSIISAYVTCAIIICTFLTSYQFLFVNMIFTSYRPIQISLAVTLFLLGIKFLFSESGKKRIITSIICFILSILLIYSTTLVN